MTAGAGLFDLSGKRALVTGARTGLGQGLALALASAGADIIGLGSQEMPETRRAVEALGRRFEEVVYDLRDPSGIAEMFAGLVEDGAAVDILINNAGQIRRSDFTDFTEEDWDDVLNINLKSTFVLSQAVVRHMLERGIKGRIVNIASLLSFQGGIRVASYTASKHAVAGLTKLMANELAAKGITVNAIAPGYMATDNTEALRNDPDRYRAILERIPSGRWGEPSDLDTAVLFFASPASGYVTGQVLAIDGGWLAR
ncbi:gluconate 5-dehydrogenase [Sinorhizobium fredii USDA 205]|uniref:2-dehydro-3-deoxy-D-gluconate 5-dehydrogenase KduD n=1 Tax=Rhizobium fredii TaxID=380 RepID=A0A844A3L5_RHIFR|nr:2-dehydro-3-deoxy-D-gluconate 5-dehydrogenase KduD [Sinorhizobium fredii]ASY72758.1 2-deoxy-D-gluconate 3-dehydrogenase [Sinorhizobium fredii CCBAU 83666]KSV86024.1 gluconate 5-dehydrogenase [Sinorhizobium fredii USDA 205]MQW97786.1 2-dehydro-3-deoxy-D-gluconate 5-dehydrogenase KduD [Sinorhizobium fredii]MQX07719.1 2-dehydro-3-deoxy-D-gluconate 5-dehydrogenase KduD [Sinorhizobium fredii]GEC31942.1 2-deoxy-D-gluconate 3-dehydrogenase [Sinorhizobium fredii]